MKLGIMYLSLMSRGALFFLLLGLMGSCNVAATGAVVQGPSNLTVQPSGWANFTCTVKCTHFIEWYVEGHPYAISSSTTGLTVNRRIIQSCPARVDSQQYIEALDILATVELNRTAVQCAAIAFSPGTCTPFLTYSRFGLLTVESETPTPVEPETPMPSPTPVVCSTQTQVLVSVVPTTVTDSVTVTESVTVVVATTSVVTVTSVSTRYATVWMDPTVPPVLPNNPGMTSDVMAIRFSASVKLLLSIIVAALFALLILL